MAEFDSTVGNSNAKALGVHPTAGFWQMLQAGILKLPFLFGPSALRRLLHLGWVGLVMVDLPATQIMLQEVSMRCRHRNLGFTRQNLPVARLDDLQFRLVTNQHMILKSLL